MPTISVEEDRNPKYEMIDSENDVSQSEVTEDGI
jgi:hypothetical protein